MTTPQPRTMRPRRHLERLAPVGGSILLFLAIVGGWQLAVSAALVSDVLVPPPAEVLRELVRLPQEAFFYDHLWTTVYEVIVGFLAGSVIGFTMGAVLGMSPMIRRVTYPFVVAFQGLPKIVLAPIFVAAFGFGVESKIAMAIVISFFPLLVNTAAGLTTVDHDALTLMRSLTASRAAIFRKLALPHALPQVFAGLKTGLTLALIGAIVGELVGASKGLGYLLQVGTYQLRMDTVYALTVILALLGVVLFLAIDWIDKRVVFWHRDDQTTGGL